MKKVLHVLGTTRLGGAESRIMDLFRNIDRSRCSFDFLITEGYDGPYTAEIEALGGHVYHLPPFRVYNYFSYVKACKAFFYEHNDYAAVQGHITSTASIYLPIASKAGIPLTIAHARSAGVDPGWKGKITRFLRRRLIDKCDLALSCSDEASVAVFGKKAFEEGLVRFIPNAIKAVDFKPDASKRKAIRDRYDLGDTPVIGHVGSFRYAKNHDFVLKVFKEFLKYRSDAKLMLVGAGALKREIEEKAQAYGIRDQVIFTGNLNPVHDIYQAFDLFLFPSHYEGMPGTVVEAEAAGLPCLISDRITRQVKVTDLVSFKSLNEDEASWARDLDSLLSQKSGDSGSASPREGYAEAISKTLYDVDRQIELYYEIYRV